MFSNNPKNHKPSQKTLTPARDKHRYPEPEDRNMIHFRALTDIFTNLNVQIPAGKKILIETKVGPDGEGDLIYQIKVYECVNELFPGQIIYRTETPILDSQRVFDTAREYHFYDKTTFEKQVDLKDVVLMFAVSYLDDDRSKSKDIRSYGLMEFRNCSEDVKNWQSRNDVDFFGLMPHAQGIWFKNVPQQNNKADLIFTASEDFKRLISCEKYENTEQIQHWLDEAWICQSHFYGMNKFLITLFAQLEYLDKARPEVKHCVMKCSGKGRRGASWVADLERYLKRPEVVEYLKSQHLRSIYFGNERFIIDPEITGRDLHLFNQRLNRAEYALFQQLINGCVFPAGDNTYCEAWSNGNATLPPFLDLRNYKQSILSSLDRFVDTLEMSNEEKLWVKKINKINWEICDLNTDQEYSQPNSNLTFEQLHELSTRVGQLWAENKNPKATWTVMHEAMREHDIAKRLPAILKEQLMFALHPELSDIKFDLINNQKKSLEYNVESYKKTVEDLLKVNKNTIKK